MSNTKSAERQDTGQMRVSIPVASIYVNPTDNLRLFPATEAEVGTLANSIREHGLINPLIVRVRGERDAEIDQKYGYILVAGFQRMRAVESLGWSQVDVTLTETLDGHLLNVDENVVRKSLSPMDQAFVCQRLKESGMKGVEIAKRMQETSAWVTGRLKFMGLRPEIQKAIHEGRVDATFAAKELALRSEAEQDEIMAGLAEGGKVAKEVKAKAKATGKEVRKAKAKKEGKKVRGRKAKKKVKAAGAGAGAGKFVSKANGHTGAVVTGALGLYPAKEWTLTPKEVLAVKVLTAVAKAKSAKAAWDGVVRAL